MKKQPYPTLLITRSDLEDYPPVYLPSFPTRGLFNPFEEMEKQGKLNLDTLLWLMRNCPLAQTPDIVTYYLSFNPSAQDMYFLIRYCNIAQTEATLAYYLSLNPPTEDVAMLIAKCPFAQTEATLAAFLSMSPSANDLYLVIFSCAVAQTEATLAHYLSLNPATEDVDCLIKNRPFAKEYLTKQKNK